MRAVTWISDNGLMVHIGETLPFLLTSPVRSSIGANANVIKAPRQDGATTYGITLDQGTVNIIGTITAIGNSGLPAQRVLDEHVNMLNSAFMPNIFGTLIYENERGTQIIRARPIRTPAYSDQFVYSLKIDIEFITDSPYWQDYTLQSASLGALEKLFTFPVTFPMKFGNYTQYSTINNSSCIEIMPIIVIYSTVEFIKITNISTNEFITVEHAIGTNQKMVIDTAEKTVSLYDNDSGSYVYSQDVSNWVSIDSKFIKLAMGDNVLKIENETQNNISTAEIFWRVPIMGV